MDSFEYNGNPSRVIFGSGTLKQLPSELSRLGVSSPLILSTPEQASQAKDLEKLLNGAVAGIFTGATMHTPSEVTKQALEFAKTRQADGLVSIGGGSTIGLGKALAVRIGWPHLCIPTTYAGSEMTPILGETENGRKTTRRDPKILPNTVIYDVDFTMTLPVKLSATSGVNAIAHSVEALYASNTNPIISLLALDGTRALASSLPEIINDPKSVPARQKALYGAWLCGVCLGSVDMGLHHKLCHTLGGMFNLPHADTHTIILPHALSYNAPAIPDAMAKLAEALPGSEGDPIEGLNLLLAKLGVKRALKDFGMKESDIEQAAEVVLSNPYKNPRKIELEPIKELIRRAWAGEPAKADF